MVTIFEDNLEWMDDRHHPECVPECVQRSGYIQDSVRLSWEDSHELGSKDFDNIGVCHDVYHWEID